MRDVDVLAELIREALPDAMVEAGAESVTVRCGPCGLVWWRDGTGFWIDDDYRVASTEGAVCATVRWAHRVAIAIRRAAARSLAEGIAAAVEAERAAREGGWTEPSHSPSWRGTQRADLRAWIEREESGWSWHTENAHGRADSLAEACAAADAAVVRAERDALQRGEALILP